ncbi:MAG: NepR family anti-sigma factor [Micropepsaceae bacterium]
MKNPGVDLKARQDVIGEGLKRIFDEIVEEPVPPEFLELLDQIDRKHEE